MPGHAVPLSVSRITAIWRDLNTRYFDGALPPIAVVWSRRLTASVGMFVSRAGPRSAWRANRSANSREIRLSLPLLTPLLTETPYGTQELVSTLAHEMIHQWQFDVLKRRPNHGPDFLEKDDGDEPRRCSCRDHLPLAQAGSAGAVQVCLALRTLWAHLPPSAADDPAAPSPLRQLPRRAA